MLKNLYIPNKSYPILPSSYTIGEFTTLFSIIAFHNTHYRKQKDHKHLPVISKVKGKNRPIFMKLAIGHKTPTFDTIKKGVIRQK